MSYIDKIKDVDLEQFNHGVMEYEQSHLAADQYAYEILTGKIPSNREVKTSCARYVYDRAYRTDIEWRTDEVDHIISFTNKLRHSKGRLGNKPIYLMMWMIFVLANMFGWYCVGGDRDGERRFIKTLVLVGRGNAKSMLASIVCLYMQLTSPNLSPSSYIIARTQKQSGIVFSDCKKMIKSSEWEVSSMFESKAFEILCPINGGEIRALASEGQSADGLRTCCLVADEIHGYNSAELLNTMVTGAGSSVDPCLFFISTAGINLDGICIHERNLVNDINNDLTKEDSYFGVIYGIEDNDDYEDSECWIKANPSLGHSVNVNALKAELARAKQTTVSRNAFLTKYMNRFVNSSASPYLDILEMQTNCAKDLDIRKYFGRECYAGLDLAQRFDLASLALLFPEEDGSVTAFAFTYCAYGALKKLTASKYEMYISWEESGCLILTEGNSTDFEYIKDDIRWIAKEFDLQMVGYDPYAATQLALSLESEGIEMVEVRQGYAQLSEPSKLLQTLISESKFNYDKKDKCLEWCAANCSYTADRNENIKVHKALDKPHDKVDVIVAILTGLNPESLKEPKKKNPYRKRGMIMI